MTEPAFAASYKPPLDRPAPRGPRTGLCLCGGGITGAMYEVGCLAALEDAFDDFYACDFDAIVGGASGATVAMALAGGLRASRLYRALLDPADDFFPFGRQHFFRADAREWKRIGRTALSAARRAALSIVREPLETNVWRELERFIDSLPAGLLSLESYEAFLRDFMHRRDIPDAFEQMSSALAIVAHDLDAGQRVVFGQGPVRHVPVARAVTAASAIPILFTPVRIHGRDYIDGGLGDTANADVALSMGCERVLVINPMVPIRSHWTSRDIPTGHGNQHHVRDKGLLWVYHQALRMRSQERLAGGLERLENASGTDVLLLQPEGDDAVIFMHSPMNFDARRSILTHAYRTTHAALACPDGRLRQWITSRGFGYKVRHK